MRYISPFPNVRVSPLRETTSSVSAKFQHHVYFFGNGAAKCMETINHPNAHLVEGIEPLAKNMAPLAEKRFVEGKFEDVAYFVPFYLKDFVAKMPKKLL